MRQVDNQFTPITYEDALSALGNVELSVEETEAGTVEPGTPFQIAVLVVLMRIPGVDTTIQAPYH